MAKDKLFTPEDFDKESKKNYRNIIQWIVSGIAILLIVLAIILGIKRCTSDNDIQSQAQPASSSVVEEVSMDSIKEDGLEKTQLGNDESLKEEKNEAVSVEEDSHLSIIENSSIQISSDVEKEAIKVIRGDYGNNPARKNVLGDGYQNIQNRVNELKRQGAF